MSYIADSDVTDAVLSPFISSGYHTETDNYCKDVARDKGVFDPDNIATESDGTLSNFTFKRLAVCYVSYRIAEDKTGVNPYNSAEDEKYRLKRDYYLNKCTELYDKLNSFMIFDTDNNIDERGGIGNIGVVKA